VVVVGHFSRFVANLCVGEKAGFKPTTLRITSIALAHSNRCPVYYIQQVWVESCDNPPDFKNLNIYIQAMYQTMKSEQAHEHMKHFGEKSKPGIDESGPAWIIQQFLFTTLLSFPCALSMHPLVNS
jgi:hypothetical protein